MIMDQEGHEVFIGLQSFRVFMFYDVYQNDLKFALSVMLEA